MKHLDNVTEVDVPYRVTGFLSVYEQVYARMQALICYSDYNFM